MGTASQFRSLGQLSDLMGSIKQWAKALYDSIPWKRSLYTKIRQLPIPEKIYRHLHFKGIIEVDIDENKSFLMHHHGFMIENELFWKGLDGWEKISSRLWVMLSRDASVILDIGANTGVYALMAKTVNPNATVIAAEPVGRVFTKMVANFDLNKGNILAVNAAISDTTGVATLYDLPDSDHVLSVSLESDWNPLSTRRKPVQVPCMTVMDLLNRANCDHADLLKIDVESHEPAVIDGCLQMIRNQRPTLLIEILSDQVANRISVALRGLNYLYYNIDEMTWPPKLVTELSQSGHFNFLICRPEVARSIGLPVQH